MPRFFVRASQIGVRDNGEKTVLIIGDDAMHITKSLRMKAGEPVCVCDMAGGEYDCRIESVGGGAPFRDRRKAEQYRAAL